MFLVKCMRTFLDATVLGTGILLAATGFKAFCAQNRVEDTAHTVIEKAIRAQGGEARLVALTIHRQKTKGILIVEDKEISFSAEKWEELPSCTKMVARLKAGDIEQIGIRVANREKAWRKLDNIAAAALPKEVEAQMRAGLYNRYLMTLVPLLRGEGISLMYLGESVFSKKPVLGVRAVSKDKDKDNLELYFDKETALLVRCVAKPSDPASKLPATDERLSDYKDFNGLKYPTLSVAYYGGRELKDPGTQSN